MERSGSYNYKIIVPRELENKIRFICKSEWNKEWSGALFYKPEGTFKDNNLVINCVDIFVMDIGSGSYTDFNMNPDVINYMCNNQELLECQIGLIHSHDVMPTFFSSTDTSTLRDQGNDMNNFVSLIVNNEGTYSAAITRKINLRNITETLSFEFFDKGTEVDTKKYSSNKEIIEWFPLKVEVDREELLFPDLVKRLNSIKESKSLRKDYSESLNSFSGTIKKAPSPVQGILPFKDKVEPYKGSYIKEDKGLPYGEVHVKNDTITSIVRQLVTCSLIIPRESKIDINKWANSITTLYEKRFGSGEEGMKRFQEWADVFVEFLTYTVSEDELEGLGYDPIDIQSICAFDLISALEELPSNKYIKGYINELEKYIL